MLEWQADFGKPSRGSAAAKVSMTRVTPAAAQQPPASGGGGCSSGACGTGSCSSGGCGSGGGSAVSTSAVAQMFQGSDLSGESFAKKKSDEKNRDATAGGASKKNGGGGLLDFLMQAADEDDAAERAKERALQASITRQTTAFGALAKEPNSFMEVEGEHQQEPLNSSFESATTTSSALLREQTLDNKQPFVKNPGAPLDPLVDSAEFNGILAERNAMLFGVASTSEITTTTREIKTAETSPSATSTPAKHVHGEGGYNIAEALVGGLVPEKEKQEEKILKASNGFTWRRTNVRIICSSV
jgi:hypothetical protein